MTFQAFEQFYTELKGEFEGYIKLSDSKEFHIINAQNPALSNKNSSNLPSWQSLHNGKNFIYELCLFEPSTKRSINVRQVNNRFKLLDCRLDEVGEHTLSVEFLAHPKATQTHQSKIKITQVWEEQNDALCCNFPVLTPTMLLFSGFSLDEAKSCDQAEDVKEKNEGGNNE